MCHISYYVILCYENAIHTTPPSDSLYDRLCRYATSGGVTAVCDVIFLGSDVNFQLVGPFQKSK